MAACYAEHYDKEPLYKHLVQNGSSLKMGWRYLTRRTDLNP